MIIKDINKKVKNTPDNITEELAPISEEYIRGLFEGLSGDDANPIDYYTKAQTDFKIDEVKGQVATVDSKVNTSNQKITSIETNLGKVENTKFTTTNGAKEFTCTEDGYVDNVYLEGQTLVNVGEIKQKSWSAELQDCIRCRFYEGGNQNYYLIHDGTYTFYNFTNKKLTFPFLSTSSNSTWGTGIDVPANSCVVANVPNDYTCVGVDFWVRNGWQQSDMDGIGSKDVMVLKGEHSFMPYFQGMVSVGQNDKIDFINCTGTELPLEIERGDINLNDGAVENISSNYRTKDFINVIGINTISATDDSHYILYDSNKSFIKSIRSVLSGTTVDVSQASYIKLWTWSWCSDIKLLKDYTFDKKRVGYTFRCTFNIKDTLHKQDNKYYVSQRCGEIILDPSKVMDELWFAKNSDGYIGFKIDNSHLNIKPSAYCLSDRFKNGGQQNVENIHVSDKSNHCFAISILASKLDTPDVAGFKAWLTKNPTKIVYELDNYIINELPNLNPRTFKGKNITIINSGNCQVEINFEVTNSLGSRLDTATEKISAIDTSIQSMQKIHYSKVEPTNDLGKDGDLWVIYEE